MQGHAHAKDMCVHKALQTIGQPPTQLYGPLYSNFNKTICSQKCKEMPHINPLCMLPFKGHGLPHLGHQHIGKALHRVLLKVHPLYQGTVRMHMCCIQLISV